MKRFLLLTLLSLGLLPLVANSIPMLELSSGGSVVTVSDNGLGDSSPIAGVIVVMSPVGDFMINVTTGLSKPAIGSATDPRLDLHSVNVSGAAGTLTIKLTDTDFISPFGSYTPMSTAIGGTTDGTVMLASYVDDGNLPFGMTAQIADLSLTGNPFAGSASSIADVGSPYSLTMIATIIHSAAWDTTSFDSITSVPEPATLGLFGIGLVGLAFASRRKKHS